MNQYFKKRENCSICQSLRKKILISKKFLDPAVYNFINSYYQGKIDKKFLENVDYEVVECLDCGFIWQVYVFNDEMMNILYDELIDDIPSLKKKKEADISLFNLYSDQMMIISNLFKNRKPFEIKVLDFGMGWGHWLLMAKSFGYNAFGFELSRSRIDFALNNGLKILDNFSELENYKFDFINLNHSLEHIENFKDILKSLSSILNKGGIIRISVPSRRGLKNDISKSDWKALKNAIQPLEHINSFSHKNLIELGRQFDLKKINSPFFISGFKIKNIIIKFIKNFYYNNFGTALYFRK